MEHHDGAWVSYPVTLEAPRPAQFDRVQLLLRLLVLAVIGLVHQTAGGLVGFLFLLVPVVVGVLVSQRSGPKFLAEEGRRLVAALDWMIAFYGYLLFVLDRFPLRPGEDAVHVTVRPRGAPTTVSALSRLLTSLPHAVVLAALGIACGLVGLVAAVSIAITEQYPEALFSFQRDVLGYMARLFAYHASLVDTYPPFSLGSGGGKPSSNDGGYAPRV